MPVDCSRFRDEYPFASHFIEHTTGHRQHYVDEGSGETLLCVHGNPTWSFAWRNVIQRFRDRYRVIALDPLGCGFSSKPQAYPYRLANHIANLQALIDACVSGALNARVVYVASNHAGVGALVRAAAAGIPAGVEAFRIARKVFQEEGVAPSST